jgi:serine/threonine protein kinase/Tfp pilus assembly protein PilF
MKCPKCQTDNPDDSKFCKECASPLSVVKDVSVTATLEIPKVEFSEGVVIADKYQIAQKIGEGGMGIVYKAKDTKLDRSVALKFLSSDLTRDREARKRFIQEALAAAALDHPNICTIYEFDEAEGKTFISMAYIEGQSLKTKIDSGPIELDEAVRIAMQVAEGLQEAHKKGVVHRDIKSDNIMIDERGQPKIMDFGLARIAGGALITKEGMTMGTIAYMSPEQARGEEVDQRSDIWSLGVVFYELLTGQLPFKGEHDQTVVFSILNDDPKPISSLRPDTPMHVKQVVYKALEKDHAQRYQSAHEFIQDLKKSRSKTTSTAEISIAVLPFVDMSAKKNQEYFCDGMAEELINALSRIEKLKIASRTSSFQFKGQVYDISEIGRKLRVQTILEGSVRKAGNRLRITAQLIEVENGYHIWSDKYDRESKDVFAIQDEISGAIIENLKVKLLGKEKSALMKHHTDDPGAYNLYLQGRYFWNSRYEGGMRKGLDYFKKAIECDPHYALPYLGIADLYSIAGMWGMMPPKEAFPKAKTSASRALEIDDSLGEAFNSLAFIRLFYDWDYSAAEVAFKKALELSPGYATAHEWYSLYLSAMRRFDEAIAEAKRAQELDPLSHIINAVLGRTLLWAFRYDEAIEQLNHTLELNPNFQVGYVWLVEAYICKDMFEEAFSILPDTLTDAAGGLTYALGTIGWAYALSGQKEKALEMLGRMNSISTKGYVSSLHKAFVFLGLDEKEKAIGLLEMAHSDRDSFLVFLNTWQFFDSIRSESRYKALVKKMDLPTYS